MHANLRENIESIGEKWGFSFKSASERPNPLSQRMEVSLTSITIRTIGHHCLNMTSFLIQPCGDNKSSIFPYCFLFVKEFRPNLTQGFKFGC